MTDQIPADKVRDLRDQYARLIEDAGTKETQAYYGHVVKDLDALLPAPPLPTLADMTEEERGKHVGGQVDVSAEAFGGRAILTGFETATLMGMEFPRALILTRDCRTFSVPTDEVTPRPDLPRLEWPGDKKPAPAPSLPEGWRLADHPEYGRVIVTSPTPDVGGHVYFVSPAPSPIGNDWHLCTPDTLTFLDGPGTPPSAEPAPEVHPGVTVGEPVTDPQVMLGISIDAPDGTVVVGHTPDCHPKATVKSGSTWQSTAGMRAHLYHALGAPDYSELESLTVVRWGKETDQ